MRKVLLEIADYSISTMMGNYNYFVSRKIFLMKKKSVLFIECTELNRNGKYANILCVSILIKYMGLYLGGIGKLHNKKCLIYNFTGESLNGTPKRPAPDHYTFQAGNWD